MSYCKKKLKELRIVFKAAPFKVKPEGEPFENKHNKYFAITSTVILL